LRVAGFYFGLVGCRSTAGRPDSGHNTLIGIMLRSVRCARFREPFTAVEHGGAGRPGGVTL